MSGVERANALVGDTSSRPAAHAGRPQSDSYEDDGYVIARDPDIEVVKRALMTVIETVQVQYA